MAKKKQAGAELKNKKGLFGAKILIKIEFRGQKLTNSQKKTKKQGHFGPKNKLGLSLRRKKGFFWAKIVEKIEYKGQKLINFQKKRKKETFRRGKKLGLS